MSFSFNKLGVNLFVCYVHGGINYFSMLCVIASWSHSHGYADAGISRNINISVFTLFFGKMFLYQIRCTIALNKTSMYGIILKVFCGNFEPGVVL